MLKGFDTAVMPTETLAARAAAEGYQVWGGYLRRLPFPQDRGCLGREHIDILHRHGLGVLLYFEFRSDRVGYFTHENGVIDGAAAPARLGELGAPKSVALYGTVDTDVAEAQLAAVRAYWEPFARPVKDAGWGLGIYGNGLVVKAITDWHIEGWGDAADHTSLANASGWRGTKLYDDADVRQHLQQEPWPGAGFKVDPCEIRGAIEAGIWMPPEQEAGA